MELTRCQNAYFRYPNNMRLAYIDFIKYTLFYLCVLLQLLYSNTRYYLNYANLHLKNRKMLLERE